MINFRKSPKGKLAVLVAAAGVSLCAVKTASAADTVINCIGEQTTITGEGLTSPNQQWPEVLEAMLGTGYTVNNDGVNTGKVIDGTAKSASSLMGNPNIVIIGPFTEHDYAANITETAWQTAYQNLVEAYTGLASAPKVYVMTPPPAAFVYQSDAEQTFAVSVVKTAVLAVAQAKGLTVIDLFDDASLGMASAQPTGNPDGHFSPSGMAEVAKDAYMVLMGTGGSTGGSGAASGSSTGSSSGAATAGAATGSTSGGAATGSATSGNVASGTSVGSAGATTGSTASGDTSATGTTSGADATGSSVGTASGTSSTSGSVGSSGESTASGTANGSGSQTVGSQAGSSNSSGGAGETSSPKSSSGCDVSAVGGTGAGAGLLALFGLAFLARKKRG
jgi:MYXO-CTERM domain-containing protein